MESEPGILIFFLSFYLEIILNFIKVVQSIVCTRVDHFLLYHPSPAMRKPPNIMNLSHLHPHLGCPSCFFGLHDLGALGVRWPVPLQAAPPLGLV